MLTEEFVNKEFVPLVPSETIAKALEMMDKWGAEALPVVEPTTGKLIGQVTLNGLRGALSIDDPVSTIRLECTHSLYPHQHIFEAARSMLVNDVPLIPVVDATQGWLGILEKSTTVEALTSLLNVTAQGSVIEVEVPVEDYSLGELAQLIEQENARILGVAVRTPSDPETPFLITFKLNVKDTSPISQSLRRHGYHIRSESDSELLNLDISDRADELIRYLDV